MHAQVMYMLQKSKIWSQHSGYPSILIHHLSFLLSFLFQPCLARVQHLSCILPAGPLMRHGGVLFFFLFLVISCVIIPLWMAISLPVLRLSVCSSLSHTHRSTKSSIGPGMSGEALGWAGGLKWGVFHFYLGLKRQILPSLMHRKCLKGV